METGFSNKRTTRTSKPLYLPQHMVTRMEILAKIGENVLTLQLYDAVLYKFRRCWLLYYADSRTGTLSQYCFACLFTKPN